LEVAPRVFLRMTGVSVNEKEVLISFIVLNTTSDRDMNFGFRGTRIIDDLGNSMNLKEINFAGKVATYGGATVQMPQGVPMKLSYKFELVDTNAKEIKILEFTSVDVKFQIRDILLHGFIIH